MGHFNDGVLRTCDEVCTKMFRRSKGYAWLWNEEVIVAKS